MAQRAVGSELSQDFKSIRIAVGIANGELCDVLQAFL
jgi:hypothetical protein